MAKKAANFELETAKWLIGIGKKLDQDGGSESVGGRPPSIDPYRSRFGKASVEGGGDYDWSACVSVNQWPLELGSVSSTGTWTGSGTWITGYNTGSGVLLGNEIVRLECVGKTWTFNRDAGGVYLRTTTSALATGDSATLDGLQIVNRGGEVSAGAKCYIAFNLFQKTFDIISSECPNDE